ncbi:MAG: hypothetical protein JWM11_3448, partial [Planctomycetaceae bacterium]|nr:hypothetical protein [Planctomycetaceae bacterium]
TTQSDFVVVDGGSVYGISSQAANSELTVKLNQPINAGGFGSGMGKMVNGSMVKTKSKGTLTLRVTEYHPDEETPEDAEETDGKRLRGFWNAVEAEENGQAFENSISRQLRARIQGDRLTLQGPEPEFGTRHYDFQVDASVTPRRLVLTAADGPLTGKTITAIYNLGGGELILCVPTVETKEPPNDFKTAAGSNLRLFRFKGGLPVADD